MGSRRNTHGGARRWVASFSAVAMVGGLGAAIAAAPAGATTAGTLNYFAGSGTFANGTLPSANTPALSANLGSAEEVTTDPAGDVFIADSFSNVIEEVNTSGHLSVIAGTGTAGAATNGAATSSKLNQPVGVTYYNGNLYIADTQNSEVEQVNLSTGVLTILAGNGTAGTYTPGLAVSSQLNNPEGIVVDPSTGDLYVSDYFNNVVERITNPGNTASAVLSVFAGTGTAGVPTAGTATSEPLDGPFGLAITGGNLYIGDEKNFIVEKVNLTSDALSIFAGSGTQAAYNTALTLGGSPTSAALAPGALAVDNDGNLYIASTGVAEPTPPATPGPGVIVGVQQVIKVSTTATNPTTVLVAGNGTEGVATDGGTATLSDMGYPVGVAVDSAGNLYIGDHLRVYKIDSVATPNTPTIGTASLNSGAVTVTWTGVGNVSTYSVTPYVNNVAQTPVTVSSATSYTIPTPASGASYKFSVQAVNDLTSSPASGVSNTVNVPVPQTAPTSAPTVGTATYSGGAVSVGWTTVSGATSYSVTPYVNGVAQTPVSTTGSSYAISNPVAGSSYAFTVAGVNNIGTGPTSAHSNVVSVPMPSTPTTPTKGYWLLGGDGGVFSFGAPFYGSTGAIHLNKPVVAMASTSDGGGYWFVAADGGIFNYGDAGFHGAVPAYASVSNIVGMAADSATGGYWVVGADGGIYAFDAPYEGSLPGLGIHVNDIAGIAATASGNGYYLVGKDGSVYAFGDAKFQGAIAGTHLNGSIVSLTVDPATGGYWELGSDGGVFSYNAPFYGSTGNLTLVKPVVGMTASADGKGYAFVASDGGVFAYGDAPYLGSMAGHSLASPIVGIVTQG